MKVSQNTINREKNEVQKLTIVKRILYPAKPSFKVDGAIKVFHGKHQLKQYTTTKPPLQKIL
jgi:hypothetical protein